MTLFLLKLNPELAEWECVNSMLVRASNAATARSLANEQEQRFWLDPKKTSCEVVYRTGEPGVVITDRNSA